MVCSQRYDRGQYRKPRTKTQWEINAGIKKSSIHRHHVTKCLTLIKETPAFISVSCGEGEEDATS